MVAIEILSLMEGNMFFFFYDDKLSSNPIIQKAFQKVCFEKFMTEGYCDMNPVFGKPTLKKEEFAFKLDKEKSPLSPLFKQQYPKTLDEVKSKLLPVLENGGEKFYDDYTLFAIVFYIYRALPTYEERQKITQEMFNACRNRDNQFTNMDIRISSGIVFDNNSVDLRIVKSISNYMDLLDEIGMQNQKIFFRGHCDISYILSPSVFRNKEWLHNEKKMYQELQINCPNEFVNMKNHLEILAEMQHYGLPTRLLDITQNPLVALFFSCENNSVYTGEVILFSVSKDLIKYPQSDTVAVLASLPLFSHSTQSDFYDASINKSLSLKQFNEKISRLIQAVRLERAGFKAEILPVDLRKNLVVMPSRNNRRIDKQEGAFIICGLLDNVYGSGSKNSIAELRVKSKNGKKIICIIQSKEKLIKQLNSIGINKARIYPEIDDVADYIKNNVSVI